MQDFSKMWFAAAGRFGKGGELGYAIQRIYRIDQASVAGRA